MPIVCTENIDSRQYTEGQSGCMTVYAADRRGVRHNQ